MTSNDPNKSLYDKSQKDIAQQTEAQRQSSGNVAQKKAVLNATADNVQESLSKADLGPIRKQQDAERKGSTHSIAGTRGRLTLSRLNKALEWRKRKHRAGAGTSWGFNFERLAKATITKANLLVLHQFHCDFSLDVGESGFQQLAA
jgi:hypothetical protein